MIIFRLELQLPEIEKVNCFFDNHGLCAALFMELRQGV
jgi:hypothetical protein